MVLPHASPALQLLQRVRDEAHRFAIEFHRGRRDKAMTRSVLDELPGVGPARKRSLLQHFGTPERFLQASYMRESCHISDTAARRLPMLSQLFQLFDGTFVIRNGFLVLLVRRKAVCEHSPCLDH